MLADPATKDIPLRAVSFTEHGAIGAIAIMRIWRNPTPMEKNADRRGNLLP